MTATPTRPNARRKPLPRKSRPVDPDRQLRKTDKDKAFEAGARWFLAVSRTA